MVAGAVRCNFTFCEGKNTWEGVKMSLERLANIRGKKLLELPETII